MKQRLADRRTGLQARANPVFSRAQCLAHTFSTAQQGVFELELHGCCAPFRCQLCRFTDKGCCDVQGLNIAPTLISVAPTRTVVSSSGPLDVSPVGATETLPPLPSLPGEDA